MEVDYRHVLRKERDSGCAVAVSWTTEGRRKRGHIENDVAESGGDDEEQSRLEQVGCSKLHSHRPVTVKKRRLCLACLLTQRGLKVKVIYGHFVQKHYS